MEIEFEPTLLDAREGSGTFRARLRDYIDYAKRRNIYGKRPFAYYHGTNGSTTSTLRTTRPTGSCSTNFASSS